MANKIRLLKLPPPFDMHVHFREPPGGTSDEKNIGNIGKNIKEDMLSGAIAAKAGGFSGVLCMPNTDPPVDTAERTAAAAARAKEVYELTGVRLYICGAVTLGLGGSELTDFAALKDAGAVAVSDDGKPVPTKELMKKAAVKAAKNGLTLISHAEDLKIVDGGIIDKGVVSEKLGVRGIDRMSENVSTRREVEAASETGCHIHIAHVSTAEAVEIIRRAKRGGVPVTAETAPHYFALTEQVMLDIFPRRDADYRMNPPLRTEADRRAVIEGLRDGTIDCIATDHAPHTPADKANFDTAPNGVIGLETAVAAAVTVLYREENFSADKIVKLMCVNPRRILNLPMPGAPDTVPATITVDTEAEWTVEPGKFRSKSRNSAFKGMKLKGRILL